MEAEKNRIKALAISTYEVCDLIISNIMCFFSCLHAHITDLIRATCEEKSELGHLNHEA